MPFTVAQQLENGVLKGGVGLTTFRSSDFATSQGESLWLINAVGQWRVEYLTLAGNVGLGGSCTTAVDIIRIDN